MKKNPIEISNYIKDEFAEYISSTYTVDDDAYQSQIDEELKVIELFNGPYLHTVLPFDSSLTLNDLIKNKEISKEFVKLQTVDLNRKLYDHQVNAIRKVQLGENLVITTGTGSGKTESFLYPIVNHIMKLIEEGKKEKGVKAIFLYPMNALVNDQKDRIRSLLCNYPDITFGSFTGETPEKLERNFRKKLFEVEGIDAPQNEILSREEMRKTPPDLLFTNYSMLEYLLIRPQDYAIISDKSMKQWQFLVLDEAHTYKGTLGIELSMLLRRLTAMVNRIPQYILTSATLGDKNNIDNIISFAKNLTSASYSVDDVIFANRKPLKSDNIKYTIASKIYPKIVKNINNKYELINIVKSYGDFSNLESIEQLLYELLLHDNNVYLLFDIIQKTSIYDDVKNKINKFASFDDIELVSLIQLISLANHDGNYLYDAKFHMFISSPNRAFITLGRVKKIKFGNQTTIDGYKAFEIGACKNCNHMYIIGNIDEDGYLQPDDSVDVYENYEDAMDQKLDFFILDDDEEHDELEKYIICSKCGHVYSSENINGEACKCGNEYEVVIYKVQKPKDSIKNNITKCAYCGQTNNMGIIRSFHLNKDSATAVLAQIYYEAMGSVEEKKNEDVIIEDLFSFNATPTIENQETKQLLAFSDSRQQASFFSVFFNYNHERFLKRRIVWELLQDEKEINVKSLASKLSSMIKNKNLFDLNDTSAQSQAWTALLSDILYVDGQYSSEGIGLYSFNYDLSDLRVILDKNATAIENNFNLSVQDFISLIHVTVNRFRKQSAINYKIAELSDQEKKDAFQYIDQEKYMTLKKEKGISSYESKFVVSFIPVEAKMINVTIDYIQKVCECSDEKALKLAENLLAFMKNIGMFKESIHDAMKCYQIPVDKFIAIPYTNSKWYVCNKCKKITLYSIKDKCPEKGCNGTLQECNPDKLFYKNYYRKQYINKQIERIIVKEHTAQLSREKAREYQKDFKLKNINVLSCSTTFEMGVDIGSLENVFLRNVPPSPANYVQRAGRAGRSKDAAALVITYCGNNSHDYSYFTNPIVLINGIVNPPIFNTSNKKIIIRHILASAFGFFFRENKQYYKNAKALIYDGYGKEFLDYINSKPKKLGEYLDKNVLNSLNVEEYKKFGWLSDVNKETSRLNLFIKDMTNKMDLYKEALNKATSSGDLKFGMYFQNRIADLEKQSVVSMLSGNAVIPKYGFPVDVVELEVVNNTGKKTEYNLQRDLSVAISEYAPDSEIIVDGNKYISRYIKLPKAGSLQRYYYYECENCKHTDISIIPFEQDYICSNCGKHIVKKDEYFIIPELGFATDRYAKRARNMRPRKTYSGAIKYLGGGNEYEYEYSFNKKITIKTVNNDSLLVMNVHNFYYCPECGYTELRNNTFSNSITKRNNHSSMYGFICQNKKLERTAIGHIFQTDVIKIHMMKSFTFDETISATYAILEGISHKLQIERNDINGLVVRSKISGYDIILFDNVPGGAGHVKRLVDDVVFEKVIKEALLIASQECCDLETTCYNCLRSYYNQTYHKILKRKYAQKVLKWIISN